MKSLMVKAVLPIIVIFLFTYACVQQKQTESKDAEFYFNRGFTSHEKGQYDQAISDYTKALEINPKLAEAYLNRGGAYAKKGQLDQGDL
jgi:tetratricopeptide (TPR) repeat protein